MKDSYKEISSAESKEHFFLKFVFWMHMNILDVKSWCFQGRPNRVDNNLGMMPATIMGLPSPLS